MPHFNTIPLESSNAHDDALLASNRDTTMDVEKAQVKPSRILADKLC